MKKSVTLSKENTDISVHQISGGCYLITVRYHSLFKRDKSTSMVLTKEEMQEFMKESGSLLGAERGGL